MSAITPESLRAAGWESRDLDGFTGHVSPLWIRRDNDRASLGMIVEDRHTNYHIGTLHGGAIMTFADVALGMAVSEAIGHPMTVTLSLQTQFVSVARVGDFISCQGELVRKTKQIVFVRGLIVSGDRTIASAEGIWKVMEPRA